MESKRLPRRRSLGTLFVAGVGDPGAGLTEAGDSFVSAMKIKIANRTIAVGAARLTHPARPRSSRPPTSNRTMGKQYNKVIKQKRRAAYLKRKKAAAKAAKKK